MLPQTGKISMRDVNVELKKPENTRTSLNDNDVRNLSNIHDGRISLNDLKGKNYKKKCKVHISVKNITEGAQDIRILINQYSFSGFEKYITKDTELDLELSTDDIISIEDYSAVPGEICFYTIDGLLKDPPYKVFKDHKIVCEFKSFV